MAHINVIICVSVEPNWREAPHSCLNVMKVMRDGSVEKSVQPTQAKKEKGT